MAPGPEDVTRGRDPSKMPGPLTTGLSRVSLVRRKLADGRSLRRPRIRRDAELGAGQGGERR